METAGNNPQRYANSFDLHRHSSSYEFYPNSRNKVEADMGEVWTLT